MRKKRLYWTLQTLGWGIYFITNMVGLALDPQGLGEETIRLSRLELYVHAPLLFFFSHWVIRETIIRRKWLEINIGRVIPRILGVIIIASISVVAIANLIYLMIGTLSSVENIVPDLLLSLMTYSIFYILWSTVYFLYHFLESNNRSLKYEAAMNEMHLNQLKSQLNPHFIFNALNSMRALVDEEPIKAKVAITQLSNILRSSLITDKKKVVSFRDELNTVRDYLALEGIRFEERLKVKYNIDPVADNFEIPPMMMQTLVENAIKHGVSNLVEGGTIDISAKVIDSILIIKIRNSGQLVNVVRQPQKRSGIGLVNTKERLKLIYGEEASFKIYNENDKFVVTEVKIPHRI